MGVGRGGRVGGGVWRGKRDDEISIYHYHPGAGTDRFPEGGGS